METVKTFSSMPNSNSMEWLKDNYTKHKISYLARKMGSRISETVRMLEALGVDLTLTPDQERYIREYYCEYSVKELATELTGGATHVNLMLTKVIGFIQRNGIKKNYIPAPQEHKRKIVRVRGQQQNELHSDRVSKWLSISDEYIKNHKGRINY